jgi:MarR family transcriptional regulator, 2-MHQ and catechol-resistance regulon repressor
VTSDIAPAAARAADLFADPRITAMGLLSEVYHGVAAQLASQLAEHGFGRAEFEVVLRLSRSPGGRLRMSDLAAQTSLTTSGITRLVDRLERDGLVRRTTCPSDRRGFFAELTEAGWRRIEAALPGHVDLIERSLVGLLTKDELDALLAALRKVRDVVRPEATAGS